MEARKEMALERFGIDPDQIIEKEGRFWMTAEQLGTALGYTHPSKAIRNLYNRNKEELQPYTGSLKLRSPGGEQETLVFNTDGQWIIAIMAKTQTARKFRRFVVSMLKALERDEFIHISKVAEWREELIELGIHRFLDSSRVMDRKKYGNLKRYRDMGLTQGETAKLLDVSKDTIKRLEAIPRRYELKLLEGGAL